MRIDDFIARAVSQYGSLSFFDSLRSTMPLYFFIAFLILYAGGMIALLSGLKDLKWVLLFCGILCLVAWSWVKLYQYYELKAPVKRKVFAYRLAQGLSMMELEPEISISGNGRITGRLKTAAKNRDIVIRYSQDLWLNVGGIVPGTPVQTLRKIHPRTWFLEIRGNTGKTVEKPVLYDFSGRKDDDDRDDGYGVRLYDPKSHAPLDPKTHDPRKITQKLRKAIDGTVLKGILILDGGAFTLRIFDNIDAIRRWRRPAVVYKEFKGRNLPAGMGAPPEQAAFYGISHLLNILTE